MTPPRFQPFFADLSGKWNGRFFCHSGPKSQIDDKKPLKYRTYRVTQQVLDGNFCKENSEFLIFSSN